MSNTERVKFNAKRRYRAFTRLIAPQDPDWLAAHPFGLDTPEITIFDPPFVAYRSNQVTPEEENI